MAKKYDATDIEVLEGLEPVRKRPGMFIAGTDTPAGLHQLVAEIVDNSVDEAMNGHASEITVTLHADGESVTVCDDGRGIPVDLHPKFKKPALELILTTLHAGGKFSDKNYQTAGGLHGVGSSVVNALSEELVATVFRDGKEYRQSFSQGKPTSKLVSHKSAEKGTGTQIFFRPDSEIFAHRQFDSAVVRSLVRTKAYLNPGLRLRFYDEQAQTREEFCYSDGLVAYLREILGEKKLHPVGDEVFSIDRVNGASIAVAFAWTDAPREDFRSFANGIETSDGGSHEQGARSGIVRAVRNYMNVHDVQIKGVKIAAEDIREGLLCLVSVKLPSTSIQAQFQGQTKSRLNNPEVQPMVESALKGLEQLLHEKPTVAQALMQRIALAARAREASRVATQTVRRKSGLQARLALPGKLADCSSSKAAESELFLVEGDSAGGSTKQARDRRHQAVLPLRGKVLNAFAYSGKKVLENRELANVIAALGCGAGADCQVNRLRYSKVIILTDADADGMHIATLLLGFFFQFMRPLIENGSLFLGRPPLYGVFGARTAGDSVKSPKTGKAQRSAGSEAVWAYSDAELDEIMRAVKGSPRISRFKGLGEMNPDTLWETTLDPKRRTLLRVSLDNAAEADLRLRELMGSDSTLRSRLIQDHAESIEVDV